MTLKHSMWTGVDQSANPVGGSCRVSPFRFERLPLGREAPVDDPHIDIGGCWQTSFIDGLEAQMGESDLCALPSSS
jgi:hypothetical protein